jgi:hypothetical protein
LKPHTHTRVRSGRCGRRQASPTTAFSSDTVPTSVSSDREDVPFPGGFKLEADKSLSPFFQNIHDWMRSCLTLFSPAIQVRHQNRSAPSVSRKVGTRLPDLRGTHTMISACAFQGLWLTDGNAQICYWHVAVFCRHESNPSMLFIHTSQP